MRNDRAMPGRDWLPVGPGKGMIVVIPGLGLSQKSGNSFNGKIIRKEDFLTAE
jgi:hypothetical protein